MLSNDYIDNLIDPFIERQENLSSYVVNTIATRVKEIGEVSKSDVYRLQQLYKTGVDTKLINEEIAKVANTQVSNVKSMIKKVAIDTYKQAKPFYDYRHKTQIPYEQNTKLQRQVKAIGEQTADTFKNLSNSQATGFTIRNAKSQQSLKFYNVKDTYQTVIDEAIQSVTTGVLDFDTAMRRTLKQLNDSGLRRMYWDSGYSRRLDSTVRMNLLGGIRQINDAVQLQIADETKADGVELSAHSFSAPDHEPIQGHIFDLKNYENLQNSVGFKDIEGNEFSAIQRPIGEWNCRHFITAIIIDAHTPTWTSKELEELKNENHKGYTTKDGKHYTMYECTQVQRNYETNIRYAKEGYMMAKSANNEKLMGYYTSRIAELNKQYRLFSNSCGLRVQRNRTSVSGFSY